MRTTLCTLALAALVVGCSDSNNPKTIAGSYPLVSANGSSLPAVIYSSSTYTATMKEGGLIINSNGSFTDSYTIDENNSGSITESTVACNGTWSGSGRDFTFQETQSQTTQCGDFANVTWDGNNTLTVDWSQLGVPLVHRR